MSLYPFIGKGFSVSKEYGISLINRVVPIVFYITFLASISILIFAPWMIRLVYGHKFDNSIPVLQIISFLPFIIGMSNIFGIQIMLNLGLDKLFFKTTFIASVIGILLNIVMSKYYGYIGSAWNCLIVESFVTIIMYLALKREKIKIFVLDYFAPQEIIRTIKNRK
jgi:PST family polysaccharide transporter